MFGKPLRKGFSMKVSGIHLNRPDLHHVAEELGISSNDVLTKDGVLTVYNTTATCQEIVDDNHLALFVAMALHISADNISDIQEVEEEPIELDFDLSEFQDDD